MMRKVMCMALFSLMLIRPFYGHESCQALFCERQVLIGQLVEDIKSEKFLVQIASSRVTSRKIVNALIAAKRKGVVVEVVVDDLKERPSTALYELFRNKIPVFIYRPAGQILKRQHMMHKFCLLSNKVWIGNFALTTPYNHASRESAVVISEKGIVEDFMREFEFLKLHDCKRALL